ncbi:MAG: hypothetical protein ACOC16_00375 [Nanoarchaeota archaeon]
MNFNTLNKKPKSVLNSTRGLTPLNYKNSKLVVYKLENCNY